MPKKKLSTPKGSKLKLSRGMRLGKYRLEASLGVGGSCEVWKAKDSVEGIWVALKIPITDVNGRRDSRNLIREIRLVARLRHKHIMPVKNADIIDGHAVLATELSVGTLDDRTRPMAPARIISIMAQVLDGLAYAHSNRLVHCDVTPGNIFLFPNGRAALGDFGISLHRKGRVATVDDFGTPGYVAPEQAYGYPSYRSDCFSAALVLYEFLTGSLPRWPFNWPLRGSQRLRQKTSLAFERFMRKALAVSPNKRFSDSHEMLESLLEAIPKRILKSLTPRLVVKRKPNWQQVRRQSFLHKYRKTFGVLHACRDCGEPIAEPMSVCPWCGSERNRYDSRSTFDLVCPDCHKGIMPEWRFCPWCYGPGFAHPAETTTHGARYVDNCRHCGGKLMRFMRYCPWCHRKLHQNWQVSPFPEKCSKCGWPVDTNFWIYCPWCQHLLV
jgi:serine/threonine protein kinase